MQGVTEVNFDHLTLKLRVRYDVQQEEVEKIRLRIRGVLESRLAEHLEGIGAPRSDWNKSKSGTMSEDEAVIQEREEEAEDDVEPVDEEEEDESEEEIEEDNEERESESIEEREDDMNSRRQAKTRKPHSSPKRKKRESTIGSNTVR